MISQKEFLSTDRAKNLPDWIKESAYWTPTIEKVYPGLGLENFRESSGKEVTPLVPYEQGPGGSFNPNPSKAPPPVKMDVVFSSDGADGLWDILTMSMRGVSSCKHWDNKQHSKAIVSTAVHPTIGIIYLTDGSMTEYGLSINRRSLIYYSDNASWGGAMPSRITIDRIYTKTTNTNPLVYHNVDPDAVRIKNIFKKFLQSKIKKSNVVVE